MSISSPACRFNLCRKRRPCVDGPAESGSGRPFNHRLDADFFQALCVGDESRALLSDSTRAVCLVDARQHSGDTPTQRIVRRAATHCDHRIAAERGLRDDALERDASDSFICKLAYHAVDDVPEQGSPSLCAVRAGLCLSGKA